MFTSNDARSGPENSTDESVDKPGANVERASPSSPIAGLPHISSRHPHVALSGGGSRITIADDRSVASFELRHDTPGSVTATAIWRMEVEGTVTALITAPGHGLVASIERDGHHRVEVIDERGSASTLVALASRPGAVAVAGGRFIASFQASPEAPARLVEIDLTTGHRVAERDLESSDIDIATSPSGQAFTLVDRARRTLLMRSEPAVRDCPPDAERQRCSCGTESTRDRQPCCAKHEDGDARRPHDTGQGTSHRSERCPPVDAAVPDDAGGTVTVDNGRIGRRGRPERDDDPGDPLTNDCWGRVFWKVDRLRWAGSHLLATQGNHMRRMALVAADDFRILRDRDFGHAGALVYAAPDSAGIVVYQPQAGAFEWIDIEDETLAGPLHGGAAVALAPDEKTFVGQRTLSLLPDHVHGTGEVKVLVLPVLEAAQAYNEPGLSKIAAFQAKSFFGPADAYYRENSFHQSWLTFSMFGHNAGPSGLPLRLPRSVSSYFLPPFFPGGLDLVRILPLGVSALSFDGSETLSLRVVPRAGGGQTKTFPVGFAAATLRSEHDAFPVKIALSGGELAVVSIRERNGATHTMSFAFPARTIEITQADVAAGLNALADYLDDVIATAEGNAGVPGGRLFARPIVHRVTRKDHEFGELHINLGFAPGRPPGTGRHEILAVNASAALDHLGFNDLIRGSFRIGADVPKLKDYLERLVLQSQADQALGFDALMLDEVQTTWEWETSRLATRFLIADKPGGPGASVTITSASGLGQLYDVANSLPGSESTKDNANAPRDMGAILNDAFSAAMSRVRSMPNAPANPVTMLEGFDIVIVGFVVAGTKVPAAERWNASDPAGIGSLREAQTSFVAVDSVDTNRQLKSRWILAFLDDEPAVSTLCHELGHAYGFDDTYKQIEYRDDLAYLNGLSLMDSGHSALSHHAGYHKWQAGWIPEARIEDVPKPDPVSPISRESLIVPVEYWDPGMEGAVKAAFPGLGHLKVVQLMRIDLGGDMGMFDLVEARQQGKMFSQHLDATPFLLVTNAIVPWDRTRYAVEGKYRRELHRLSAPSDLNADEEEFDLASAPELAARGVKVKIVDIKPVNRPSGNVTVFHTRVTRETAAFIDLGFVKGDPYYKSPDLWLDWPGNNNGGPALVYPEGEPLDQGEPIQVPRGDTPEPHWAVARVRNYGTFDAQNVRLEFLVNRPPGGGDHGNYQKFASVTVPKVVPGTPAIVPATWNVDRNERGHTCLQVVIADSEIPEDINGIKLASADVMAVNNHAEKNVDQFVPLGGSPYEPIEFEYSINNSGLLPETAFLQPEGLSDGMRLTISPARRTIAPGETAIFQCRLELDHEVIDAGCRHDRDFTILTWRETPETSVNWGGCQYKVMPRKKTAATIKGGWYGSDIELSGRVDPDPGGGPIRLRLNFDNQKARFQTVTLGPGATWTLSLTAPAEARWLETEAFYEGSRLHAPCRSPLIVVAPYVIK